MRRHFQIPAFVIALVVFATASFTLLGPTGSASADTITRSGQVAVDSLPGSQPIVIDQFDPTLGDLTSITVIAHLSGGVNAQVWNLTTAPRSTAVTFSAAGQFVGPGAVQLQVGLGASSTQLLAAGASSTFNLSDADQSSAVVSDAPTLAAFTGPGTVTFNLNGSVQVNVAGPARWRTTGVGHAEASIEVEYEYTRATTTTSTTMPTTTTTTPPSACPSPLLIEDWSYDPNNAPNWTPRSYLDGRFTITRLYFENLPDKRWPTAFDFTSTVPVTYVAAQSHVDNGQQMPPNEYFYSPAVQAGTHLHPSGRDPDGYLGRVKDIWVCLGTSPSGRSAAPSIGPVTESATTTPATVAP